MSDYERVRFAGKTIYLRDPHVVPFMDKKALTGIEVDKTGDEIASGGADERRRIIELDLVTRRVSVRMNNHYGELEDV